MARRKQPQKKTFGKRADMTVNELAKVVSKGFGSLEARFNGLDDRVGGLEGKLKDVESRLSQQIEGVNNRIDDLALNRATRDEVYIIQKRVDRIEKKVGLKKR